MRSISSVIVGETKQITCVRPRKVKRSDILAVPERFWQRLVRKALRRPAPTVTREWTETVWDKVGETIWVVGTEDGPVARDTSPYPEASDGTP